MSRNSGTTGSRAASAAGKALANPSATRAERSAAASALSQTPPTGSPRQTGTKAASNAGKTLDSPSATKAERSAAASALSQTLRRGGKK